MRVLNFHGVVDRSTETSHFARLFTDISAFEEQVALLARRGRPLSLEELEASLTGGPPLPDDAVHVSFDDGYLNNLVAAEILARHRVPWSLFVVVDAVLEGFQPWFLRLADAIDASSNVMLRTGEVMDISAPLAKRRFARLAKAEVMSTPAADQEGAVERLLSLPGLRRPERAGWPMLETADLKELHRAGVEIGNHSARHRNLVRCSDADLDDEVSEARDRLEGALGSPVRYFAYPDGRHDRRVRTAVGARHALALATWTPRPFGDALAVRRYEPVSTSDMEAILESPEPWYGTRWARWTLPARARELSPRFRRGFA